MSRKLIYYWFLDTKKLNTAVVLAIMFFCGPSRYTHLALFIYASIHSLFKYYGFAAQGRKQSIPSPNIASEEKCRLIVLISLFSVLRERGLVQKAMDF